MYSLKALQGKNRDKVSANFMGQKVSAVNEVGGPTQGVVARVNLDEAGNTSCYFEDGTGPHTGITLV